MDLTDQKKLMNVLDSRLRAVLIGATEFWETQRKKTKSTAKTSKTETKSGLLILGEVELPENNENNLPEVYSYDYMMDLEKWKFVVENELWQIKQGHMIFWDAGIRFFVQQGAEKYLETGFTIEDGEGGQIILSLLHEPTRFLLHRDINFGKEWVVQIETGLFAEKVGGAKT